MQTVDPTIVQMRRFVFEQMQALRDGDISIHEANAQAKLAHQVMEGYKTQVRFLEVAGTDSLKVEEITQLTHSLG